jgi:hypothetical protein
LLRFILQVLVDDRLVVLLDEWIVSMSFNNDTQGIVPNIETALDWFQRSKRQRQQQQQNRRRRQQQSQAPTNDSDIGRLKLPWWAVCSDSNHPTVPADSNSLAATDHECNAVAGSCCRPIDAAHRFLWGGHSGIAPIDAAWRYAVSSMVRRMFHQPSQQDDMLFALPPSPILLLEGPPDVGKTWMMLSLAARYVVATRPQRRQSSAVMTMENSSKDVDDEGIVVDCDNNIHPMCDDVDDTASMEILPQVLFLDSNFDFSISKLTHIVQTLLERDIGRKKEANQQQRRMHPVEQQLEECLSRIHVVQVDYGSTAWVPVLEVLRHQFSKQRQHQREQQQQQQKPSEQHPTSAASTITTTSLPSHSNIVPTLLLWDGFLADFPTGTMNEVSSDSSSREVLLQLSRLLDQEFDSLWCILSIRSLALSPMSSSRTKTKAFHRGVGQQVMEWMKKHHQQQQERHRQHQPTPFSTRDSVLLPKEICRVLLDRPTETSASKSSAFALVLGDTTSATTNTADTTTITTGSNNRDYPTGRKIPYSLSVQGVLS